MLMSLNVFMLFSGTPLLVTALALDIAPAVTATVFVVFSMLALALSPNLPKRAPFYVFTTICLRLFLDDFVQVS